LTGAPIRSNPELTTLPPRAFPPVPPSPGEAVVAAASQARWRQGGPLGPQGQPGGPAAGTRPGKLDLGPAGRHLQALGGFVRPRASPAGNAVIMACGTAVSRLSGFGRLIAVAWVLGQGRLADAYNQANTVPNTVYDLLLGGVLSATLLPVVMRPLSRVSTEPDDDSVPTIVTVLTVVLVIGTGLFWLLAPYLVHLFLLRAHGHGAGAERQLATTWLRYFTPQLLLIGLVTLTTALLNARRRFAAVAFSPVVANVVTIAALAVADRLARQATVPGYQADAVAVAVVGLGTTAGYAAQLLAQLPALARARIPLRFSWKPSHPALKLIARLSGWTVGAVVANQVAFSLVSVLANSKAGNFSAFSYAYTFMQLPYAVLAVSIAYVVAPDLAQLWAEGDPEGFAARASYAMRVTVALLLPAGVGYALLARPVVVLALAHGHLALASARLTGDVLVVFACGLPGFAAFLLVMRAFQAKLDTRSMFWLYVAENALTVVAAVALYPAFGVRGLAAAWVGSYTVVLPVAWARLRRSTPVRLGLGQLGRACLATAVMAGAVAGLGAALPSSGASGVLLGRLALLAGTGGAVFVLAARLLGLGELTSAISARSWRHRPS